jgi:cytochrome c5
MKQLSLLLFISLGFLSACQAEKAQEGTDATATKTSVTAAVTPDESGQSIHQVHCTRCHGSEVYSRADHKVTSLDALGKQVRMCDSQLETQLFPEDLDKVITYLNETYYKF